MHDVFAVSPAGASVVIFYERLDTSAVAISAAEFMGRSVDIMREAGADIIAVSDYTIIMGVHGWYQVDTAGRGSYWHAFYTVSNGFGIGIAINYHDTSEPLEELLALISQL